MSDDRKKVTSINDDNNIEQRCDPTSSNFDATFAIEFIQIPNDDNVPVFESLDELERHLIVDAPDIVRQVLSHDEPSSSNIDHISSSIRLPKGKARLESVQALVTKRNQLLPPVTATVVKSKRKEPSSVLSKMKAPDGYAGPMALLARWVRERRRVRIGVRSSPIHVRRQLIATVVAFDKHWNLVLRDVDEVYWHLAKRTAERVYLHTDDHTSIPKCLKYWRDPANITNNRIEPLKRHLQCTFVKGDNVVLISSLH